MKQRAVLAWDTDSIAIAVGTTVVVAAAGSCTQGDTADVHNPLVW